MSGEPTRWEVRACGLGHRLGTVLDRAYDAANRLVYRLTGDGYQTLEEQSSWTYQWGYEMGLKGAMARALTGEGMSTRAIAPIVGVDNATVHRDLTRVANATPAVDVETGEVADIVGVDKDTVRRDLIRGGANTPPAVNVETGEVADVVRKGQVTRIVSEHDPVPNDSACASSSRPTSTSRC